MSVRVRHIVSMALVDADTRDRQAIPQALLNSPAKPEGGPQARWRRGYGKGLCLPFRHDTFGSQGSFGGANHAHHGSRLRDCSRGPHNDGSWEYGGSLFLVFERMRVRLRSRSRVLTPALRYYAVAIGMISGGLGLIGLAQALRLLAEILTTGAAVDGH